MGNSQDIGEIMSDERDALVKLSVQQIENWRKVCLSHWVSELDHDESKRQANALCDMAIAVLTAQPVKDAWLPIESAPRDGTWVLAINAATNRGRQHVVHYSERHGKAFPWVTSGAPMDFVAGITHWQPLPAAPMTAASVTDEGK
jgi:hypothetical protein